MKRKPYVWLAMAAFLVAPARAATPQWIGWTDHPFAQAKAENRFVLLDLEAVWCHWCHVMDQKTYSDPKVQALLKAKYVPVRVDQDSNPALSERYGDWGWPATIIFGPDGKEIAKLRGYIEPDRMAALLQAVIDDPSPGPSVEAAEAVVPSSSAFLKKAEQVALLRNYNESYDTEKGGWGSPMKYIDADSMDYALERAEAGDKTADMEARQTFDAAAALIDPVWGGVSQYSVGGDWTSPHYEKIMSFQAQYLRQYAQAYALWQDAKYREDARHIESYMTTFLKSPNGAFYVSQDADLSKAVDGHTYYALGDAGRRKLGMPRIDTHLYARENGWAITGLVAYANATTNKDVLDIAERAANWVLANRSLPGGGFRHSDADVGGPFLGDTLAMGQAFLDLYAATGDRQWLKDATAAGDFIGKTFKDDAGGFINAKSTTSVGVFAKPSIQLDDQVGVARFMNLLFRYSGQAVFKDNADYAMRYMAAAAVDIDRPLPGVLLANRELSSDPTHVTVVGHKDDPAAQSLFAAARALPAVYERLEWWDVREGPLPNPDVDYPQLGRAAAFACANHQCSLPAFSAKDLDAAVALMARRMPAQNAAVR